MASSNDSPALGNAADSGPVLDTSTRYQRKSASGKKRGRNSAYEKRKYETSTQKRKTRRYHEAMEWESGATMVFEVAMERAEQKVKKKGQKRGALKKGKTQSKKKRVNLGMPSYEGDDDVRIDLSTMQPVGLSFLTDERRQQLEEHVAQIENRELAQVFVDEVIAITQFEDNIRAVIETVHRDDEDKMEDMLVEALETAAPEITDEKERQSIAIVAMDNVQMEMEIDDNEVSPPPLPDENDVEALMDGVEQNISKPQPMETDEVEAKRAERKKTAQRLFQKLSRKYKGEKVEKAAREDEAMNVFADQFARFATTGSGGFAAYKLSIEKLLNQYDVLTPTRCAFLHNRLLGEVEERNKVLKQLEDDGKPFVDELRMFEYVRDRQLEFFEQIKEMHPSVFYHREETDDEFMERFQRLVSKYNKVLVDEKSKKDDSTVKLLQNQIDIETPRFKQLKEVIGKNFVDMTEYIKLLEKEESGRNAYNDIETYKLANNVYARYQQEMIKTFDDFYDTYQEFEDDSLVDWNKLWKLSNTFVQQMKDAKPVETWKAISEKIRKEVNEDAHNYSLSMVKLFEKEVKEIGEMLFEPYEPGKYFKTYENYKELFNRYMALRNFFMGEAEKNNNMMSWTRANWDKYHALEKDIEWIRTSMKSNTRPIRDPQDIERELERREFLIASILRKEDALLEKQGKTRKSKNDRDQYHLHEMNMLEKVDQSRKDLTSEWTADQLTYKFLFKEFPNSWTEAISGLEAEVTELRRRVQHDISAFGPFLSHVISSIWNKFSQKIQNVRPDQRNDYMTAIETEKKRLYELIANEAYGYTGSKKYQNAAEGPEILKDFVMDPNSFTPKDKTRMVNDTSIGLYMSNTRRLLSLIDQAMRLRQRMVSEPYRVMGLEGAKEAPKFDMVLTHLFPPSQVELKLRFLMQMPNREKYMNGPFVKAIKMLFPDFDLKRLSNENFITEVSQISQASKEFLKTVVGMTPIAWSDFENQADELTRIEYEILSQVEDKPIEDPAREQDSTFQPTDAPPYDRDAGAVMNDAGLRVNPTFNPVTQGQITRDAIDDAKRVSYIQIAGSLASVFLDPPDSTDPYVPLHVSAAKFFFSKDNYKTLGDQFDSMRPLQPKQTVDDPNGKIEEILSRYGKFLGIKKRATMPTDHPILVQQEAIELTEFVNAFKSYGQQTAGNYVHPVDPTPSSMSNGNTGPPQPSASNSGQKTNGAENIDPNDAGESVSDPLISGLRAAYQSAPRYPGDTGGGGGEDDGGDDGALWGGWAPPS